MILVLVLVLVAYYPNLSYAQGVNYDAPRSSSVLRGNGLQSSGVGDDEDRPIGLHGSVSVSISKQQNVLRDNNADSDTVVTISPLLWYQQEFGRHGVVVRYRGDYFKFKDFSGENSIDHNLQSDVLLDMSEKLQVRIGAGYVLGHETRGLLGTVDTSSDKPNKFKEQSLEGSVTYGRRENTIQLSGTVGISQLKFTNNNAGEGRGNINSDHIGGTVYYNLGPRTALLAKLGRTNIDYVDNSEAFDLDSKETSAGIGVRWEATEITTGEASVSKTKKDLTNPSKEDFSGITYSGRVKWAPLEYSVFSLYGTRSTEESTSTNASYIISDEVGVSWSHILTQAWSLNAFASKGKDEFSDGRRDNLADFGMGVNYGLFSWGSIGLQYAQTKRSSSDTANNFDDETLVLLFSSNFGLSG